MTWDEAALLHPGRCVLGTPGTSATAALLGACSEPRRLGLAPPRVEAAAVAKAASAVQVGGLRHPRGSVLVQGPRPSKVQDGASGSLTTFCLWLQGGARRTMTFLYRHYVYISTLLLKLFKTL